MMIKILQDLKSTFERGGYTTTIQRVLMYKVMQLFHVTGTTGLVESPLEDGKVETSNSLCQFKLLTLEIPALGLQIRGPPALRLLKSGA